MGFGSGVLISAVAYELALEAFETSSHTWHVAAGLFAGSFTFFVGDALIALGALAAFLQLVLNGGNPTGVVALFEVALLVATVVVIAVGVVDQHDVNAQSIFGAVSIYVLLGMLSSSTALRPRSGRARSSPRGPTARCRLGSTSATSRSPRSATATTPPPATSGAPSR
jgi:hypothetical protein